MLFLVSWFLNYLSEATSSVFPDSPTDLQSAVRYSYQHTVHNNNKRHNYCSSFCLISMSELLAAEYNSNPVLEHAPCSIKQEGVSIDLV